MKLVLCCLVVLTAPELSRFARIAALTSERPSASPQKPLELVEAREVLLEKPLLFWRGGRQESAGATVLLRVKVRDLVPFLPRGTAVRPLFVYGSAVCEELQSPPGDAVLLAPQVSAGEPPVLWLTPLTVRQAKDVDTEVIRRYRPKQADLEPGGGLLVKTTVEPTGRVYKDVEELKAELAKEFPIMK